MEDQFISVPVIKKCWTCGKEFNDVSNVFCSRRCSLKAIERAAFIRRTNKDAQLYYRYYQMTMERYTWLEKEN